VLKVNGIKLLAHATALAAGLVLGAANAVGLFIDPTDSPAQLPPNHDVIESIGLDGFINGYLGIDFGSYNLVEVVFEYRGSEASYRNSIVTGLVALQPGLLGNHGVSSKGDTSSYLHPVGVLDNYVDFVFLSNLLPVASNLHPVLNPTNNPIINSLVPPNDSTRGMGYWLSQAGLMANQAYIGLDDGGAGPDSDYDDLVVLVTVNGVTEVPVPATVALMGLGVLGLGLRRKLSA
jgi:hypothetical protein